MYRPESSAIYASVGQEAIVLNLASGVYYGLNSVAARAWELLASGNGLDDVAERLLAEFDVARDTLEHDLSALVARLVDLGLLQLHR